MREASKRLVVAVMMDDGLGNHHTEACHPVCQPSGHASAVEGQIGAASSSCHCGTFKKGVCCRASIQEFGGNVHRPPALTDTRTTRKDPRRQLCYRHTWQSAGKRR